MAGPSGGPHSRRQSRSPFTAWKDVRSSGDCAGAFGGASRAWVSGALIWSYRSPSSPTISLAFSPPRRACRRPRVATATAMTTSSGLGESVKVTEIVS